MNVRQDFLMASEAFWNFRDRFKKKWVQRDNLNRSWKLLNAKNQEGQKNSIDKFQAKCLVAPVKKDMTASPWFSWQIWGQLKARRTFFGRPQKFESQIGKPQRPSKRTNEHVEETILPQRQMIDRGLTDFDQKSNLRIQKLFENEWELFVRSFEAVNLCKLNNQQW